MTLAAMFQRKLQLRTVAGALVATCLCGLGVLGFLEWKAVVPALVALGAAPFVLRGILQEGTPARTPVHPGGRLLATLTVLIAGTLVLFLHKPDALLNPQFWAEDAFLFEDARNEGFSSIFHTLDRAETRRGQTVLFQRVVAAFGRFFPPLYTPRFYVLCALLATLAVAVYLLYAPIDGLGIVPRVLLAFAIMIAYSPEVYLNLINTQWVVALALIVFLIQDEPRSRAGRLAFFVAFVACGLTGPFITLLSVLFLIRAVVQRTPFSVALFALSLPCAVWHAIRTESSNLGTRALTMGSFHPLDPNWRLFLGRNYVGRLFLGPLIDDIGIRPFWYLGLFAIVYLVLLVYVVKRRDFVVGMLLLAGLLFLASAAYVYRRVPVFLVIEGPKLRYYFIPIVCLTWGFIIMTTRLWGTVRCVPGVVVLAAVVLAAASDFTLKPVPDMCWDRRSLEIDGPRPCVIPINPVGAYNFPYYTIHYDPAPSPQARRVRP